MDIAVPILLLLTLAPTAPRFTSPKSASAEYGFGLTQQETRSGWISLFDGKTAFGWTSAKTAGDRLIGGTTTSNFGDYELKAEFVTGGTITLGSRSIKVKTGTLQRRVVGHGRGRIRLGQDVSVRKLAIRPLGLKTVFNGKDFSDWRVLHDPRRSKQTQAKWRIVGSSIRAVGGPAALELQQRYGDLVLQIDVRTIATLANGGVFFRCIEGDFMNGYEAQVFNACYDNDPGNPARYSTGGIDDRQLARRLVSRDGKVFTMTVVAIGPHIATWVNGYQMTDWTDTRKQHDNPRHGLRTKSGTIQLQAHDPKTAVEFSNIRVGAVRKQPCD